MEREVDDTKVSAIERKEIGFSKVLIERARSLLIFSVVAVRENQLLKTLR